MALALRKFRSLTSITASTLIILSLTACGESSGAATQSSALSPGDSVRALSPGDGVRALTGSKSFVSKNDLSSAVSVAQAYSAASSVKENCAPYLTYTTGAVDLVVDVINKLSGSAGPIVSAVSLYQEVDKSKVEDKVRAACKFANETAQYLDNDAERNKFIRSSVGILAEPPATVAADIDSSSFPMLVGMTYTCAARNSKQKLEQVDKKFQPYLTEYMEFVEGIGEVTDPRMVEDMIDSMGEPLARKMSVVNVSEPIGYALVGSRMALYDSDNQYCERNLPRMIALIPQVFDESKAAISAAINY